MSIHPFPAPHALPRPAPAPASPPLPHTVAEAFEDAIRIIDERLRERRLCIRQITELATLRARLIDRRDEVRLAIARAL